MTATTTKELTARELMTLLDCLYQYERKVSQALSEASDITYGWSLLVQEEQHLANTRAKLEAQLIDTNARKG